MSSFEFNKLFAAILVAGITAYMGWFISGKLVYPHKLKKNAVEIEGGPVAGGGPKKEKKAEPILHLIATADIARGEKLSKACAACHSFDNGGANKVGPNLWNVMGNVKAAKSGFGYSTAMAEFGGDWDYLAMNQFMWKPKKYMPGTKMNYNGIKKPEDRAAMIAWLRSLSSSPIAQPSQAQIDAEIALLAPPEEEIPSVESDSAESEPEDTTAE